MILTSIIKFVRIITGCLHQSKILPSLSTNQDQFQLLIFDTMSADLKDSPQVCFSKMITLVMFPLFVLLCFIVDLWFHD